MLSTSTLRSLTGLLSRPRVSPSFLGLVCLIALLMFTVAYMTTRTTEEVDSPTHDGHVQPDHHHSDIHSWSKSDSSMLDNSNIIPVLLQRIDSLESKYERLLSNQRPLPGAISNEASSLPVIHRIEGDRDSMRQGRDPQVHNPRIEGDRDSMRQGRGPQVPNPRIEGDRDSMRQGRDPQVPNPLSSSSVSVMDIPDYRAEGVNCGKLFAGDKDETARAKNFSRPSLNDDVVGKSAEHCPLFLGSRRYIMNALSTEEADFPIAFSIVMHNEVEHFERLLRSIYRPQNLYCIHIDLKAHEPVRKAVEAIVACFANVFTTSRSVDVQWAQFSIIEPELICMEELLLRNKRWKYFINLTGQEFPLKTNWDIVRILKAFNGSNNMEGTVERRDNTRITNKPPPPVPVTLTKGSVHIVVTREFVNYILYNKDALAFRDWVKDTYIPDETFFSSLNHSPQLGVPGAYLGKPETDTDHYMFIARFKNWGDGPFNWPCFGQRVRYVCVFGVGDLPLLASRPELFANKFYADYQPATLDCMEELHYNRTRAELLGRRTFDSTFYEKLAFVKNHI